MKRKSFIQTGISGLVGLGLPVASGSTSLNNDPEPIDNKMIEEFVRAGHRDLPKVKKMIEEMPNLIYCRYDWGGGDFVRRTPLEKKRSKGRDMSGIKRLPTT